MPSGKIHNALTLSTLSGVLAPYAIVQIGLNPWSYCAGMLCGVFISPDLDLDGGNISDTLIRKVSTPAQVFWRVAWTPYSKAVPHRHAISHFPILGTTLRLGYIFLIINLVNWIMWSSLRLFGIDNTVSFLFIWDWSFFLGLAHADTIHWVADNKIKGSGQ